MEDRTRREGGIIGSVNWGRMIWGENDKSGEGMVSRNVVGEQVRELKDVCAWVEED